MLQTPQRPVIEKRIKINYEYTLKPYDRIMIILYKYPDLQPTNLTDYVNGDEASSDTRGLMLDSAGMLSLPMIGKIKLAGMTQPQAARMLENMYSEYVKDPSINLQVVNKRAYIIGEVKSPQAVTMDRDISTIFEMLSYAGGFTDSAQKDNIIVLSHNEEGYATLRRIDLTSFDAVATANIYIKPNDVIYIPPDSWKVYNLNSYNFTSVFRTISSVASPIVTLKALFNWDF